MSDTALLVIDAQESFRQRPDWFDADEKPFLAKQRALIDGAKAAGHRIVRVFHTAPQGVFSVGSGFVRPIAGLEFAADAEFFKTRHSALVGTGLDVWLTANGIKRIIVSGIRTEQCCETTARHASDAGWQVDYVTEATHTSSITDREGRTWSVEDIKARTAAMLDKRFARVCTVAEALAGAPVAAAA